MTEPRIALGFTLTREVDALVALQWLTMLRADYHWQGPVYNGRAVYTVQARNNVMTQAFEELDRWDALFFWDSDQMPPMRIPGPIPWLEWKGGLFTEYVTHAARSELMKVIGGLYYSREDVWAFVDGFTTTDLPTALAYAKDNSIEMRVGPYEPVAYRRLDTGTYRYLQAEEVVPMLQRRDRYVVGGVGTGSMLIQKDILLRMAELKGTERIFEAPQLKEGQFGGIGNNRGVNQLGGSQWTEDLFFCEEVTQRLGERVWLDTAMESGHRRDHWVYSPDYLTARTLPAERMPNPPRGTAPKIWIPS